MSNDHSPVAPERVLQSLKWRYAVQKFDANRKIPSAVWNVLEEVLTLTPSSFGLQPWKFIVITNQDVKNELMAACFNQRGVSEASHVVVFAGRKTANVADAERYLQRISEIRSVSLESLVGLRHVLTRFLENSAQGYDLDAWAAKQVYIALGNFMTSAALMGVDTCPMEGFVPEKIDAILKLPTQGYTTVVLAPAGYRSIDDKYATMTKVRFKTSDLIQRID